MVHIIHFQNHFLEIQLEILTFLELSGINIAGSIHLEGELSLWIFCLSDRTCTATFSVLTSYFKVACFM